MKCQCCQQKVSTVDEQGLCFACDLVQTFSQVIEEETDLEIDAAIDIACKLVEYAQARILELRDDGKAKTFFADVQVGMVRTTKAH